MKKDEPVPCANAVSDEEIDQHFELLHFIEPSLSRDSLTVKALNLVLRLRGFLIHAAIQVTMCSKS